MRSLAVLAAMALVACAPADAEDQSVEESPTPAATPTPTIEVRAEWETAVDFDLHVRNDHMGTTFAADTLLPWDCTYQNNNPDWGCTHSGDADQTSGLIPYVETATVRIGPTLTIGLERFSGEGASMPRVVVVSNGTTLADYTHANYDDNYIWVVGSYSSAGVFTLINTLEPRP